MTALNELDRYHLAMDAVDRLLQTGNQGMALKQQLQDSLFEHRQYIGQHRHGMSEIRNWQLEGFNVKTRALRTTTAALVAGDGREQPDVQQAAPSSIHQRGGWPHGSPVGVYQTASRTGHNRSSADRPTWTCRPS